MSGGVRSRAVAAAAACLVLLSACGGGSEAATDEASSVTIVDPWVKATDAGVMTASFGTFTNASDDDVTIVAAETEVSPTVELHEMATDDAGDMVMQEKEGGIVVPGGGDHELSPGGDHIMFLDPPEAIRPGQDVTVTVTFSDDSTMSFTAAARSFSGANEDYDPEGDDGGTMDHGDMDGMDHGDMDHGSGEHGD